MDPEANMDSDIHALLEAAAERRRQGLAMADSAIKDVADLLPDALAAGMSKDEVAELAGVSRPTLDAVARRRRKEPDYRLSGVVERLSSPREA